MDLPIGSKEGSYDLALLNQAGDEVSRATPQWSPQNRPMVVRAKPANGKRPGTQLFYPVACCGSKSIFVRQLRGPHLST
jgi:hypothetical protein